MVPKVLPPPPGKIYVRQETSAEGSEHIFRNVWKTISMLKLMKRNEIIITNVVNLKLFMLKKKIDIYLLILRTFVCF